MATPCSTKLPLKLQVAVRDLWDKQGTPVQEARAAVAAILGFPVRCDPDWSQLLAACDAATPKPLYADDRAQLAVVVAGCVEVWCRVLADLLTEADEGGDKADAAHQAWAEEVVERTTPGWCLQLFVEVANSDSDSDSSKTTWLPDRAAFVLRLPAHAPVVVPSDEALAYREGLLNCFKPSSAPNASGPALAQRSANSNTVDDWADVAVDGATGTAAIIEPPASSASPSLAPYAHLPSVASLPRPEDLLRRPPYHLRVTDGYNAILINGSHSPSLRLLGAYLERWCRTNHKESTKPPVVETEYRTSCWATSTQTIDGVVLTLGDKKVDNISSSIVLAFVEGVLGYTLVHTDGKVWSYRRTQPFKE